MLHSVYVAELLSQPLSPAAERRAILLAQIKNERRQRKMRRPKEKPRHWRFVRVWT
jgi:hypothetical protein